MRYAQQWTAIAFGAITSVLGAQDPAPARSMLPDSGAFFTRTELQLLDLGVAHPLTEGPDCAHDRVGYRGGSLSFRRIGAVTTWTVVDTVLRCDATNRPYPVGTRRDSGYVDTSDDQRRVLLEAGYHSNPLRVSFAELRWLDSRRDSLVLFGSDSLRRDLYISAPAPKERPNEEL
jgi:hypothetical protein